jgi:hypothetical protein
MFEKMGTGNGKRRLVRSMDWNPEIEAQFLGGLWSKCSPKSKYFSNKDRKIEEPLKRPRLCARTTTPSAVDPEGITVLPSTRTGLTLVPEKVSPATAFN